MQCTLNSKLRQTDRNKLMIKMYFFLAIILQIIIGFREIFARCNALINENEWRFFAILHVSNARKKIQM